MDRRNKSGDDSKEDEGVLQPPPQTPLVIPIEYAAVIKLMVTNSYFNSEDVRLDGAIRMAPR